MATQRMKTPISYYGGKQRMLKYILPHVPDHSIYTEAFAGGAAVFFAKPPADVEVINDVNNEVINFYRVLKTSFKPLQERCNATLHSRATYEFACIVSEYSQFFTDVERAWAFWVLSRQSFASKIGGSWGYDKKKNTMSKKLCNDRRQFTQELSDRLEHTQIECSDALHVIKTHDSPQSFHFVDPPYVNTNMGHYTGTFNETDFKNLLELLSSLEGRFMLTMFPNDLMQSYIDSHGWRVIEVERTISASKSKRRSQVEMIVMNY